MGKSLWSLLGYKEKQNNSDAELPLTDEELFVNNTESLLADFFEIEDKGKEKVEEEEEEEEEEEVVVLNSDSNTSGENTNNNDFPEYNLEDLNAEETEEGVGSSTGSSEDTENNLQIVPYPNMPAVGYTNAVTNFLTNMNNGSGADLLTNGIIDLNTGIGHFGDAGKGLTKAMLSGPALATQALTISQGASYLIFAADNLWLVGATIGQIPYAGPAVMVVVKVASTLMLVHPVLVTGGVALLVVGIYQEPVKDVCGGIKDTLVGGALGTLYTLKGAAELLGMPIGGIKDIFSNIVSTQNPTKSATETVEIDLSDIKPLTLKQIAENYEEMIKSFYKTGQVEDKELEIADEAKDKESEFTDDGETSNNENDQNITKDWYGIISEGNEDNLAKEIAAKINDEKVQEIINGFTNINLFEHINVDSGDESTITGENNTGE